MSGPWFEPYGMPSNCNNAWACIKAVVDQYFENEAQGFLRQPIGPTFTCICLGVAEAEQDDNDMAFRATRLLSAGSYHVYVVNTLALGGTAGSNFSMPPPDEDVYANVLQYAYLVDNSAIWPSTWPPVLGAEVLVMDNLDRIGTHRYLDGGDPDPNDMYDDANPTVYTCPVVFLLTVLPPDQKARATVALQEYAIGAMAVPAGSTWTADAVFAALATTYGIDTLEEGAGTPPDVVPSAYLQEA